MVGGRRGAGVVGDGHCHRHVEAQPAAAAAAPCSQPPPMHASGTGVQLGPALLQAPPPLSALRVTLPRPCEAGSQRITPQGRPDLSCTLVRMRNFLVNLVSTLNHIKAGIRNSNFLPGLWQMQCGPWYGVLSRSDIDCAADHVGARAQRGGGQGRTDRAATFTSPHFIGCSSSMRAAEEGGRTAARGASRDEAAGGGREQRPPAGARQRRPARGAVQLAGSLRELAAGRVVPVIAAVGLRIGGNLPSRPAHVTQADCARASLAPHGSRTARDGDLRGHSLVGQALSAPSSGRSQQPRRLAC